MSRIPTFTGTLVKQGANQWDCPLEMRTDDCLTDSRYIRKFVLTHKNYPSSFTLKDGGNVFLYRQREYGELFRNLAYDIVHNVGRISLCERFPPFIIPNLTRLHPQYTTFVHRARRMMDPMTTICRREQNWTDALENQDPLDTFECIYAVDLDLGNRVYSAKDLRLYVRLIQQIMCNFGARPHETLCIVFKSDDQGKLGLHLYFIASRYFAEECWWLTYVAQCEFEDKWRTPPGKRPWTEIIDIAIHNGSLRCLGVQKGEECECVKESRKSLSDLGAAGRVPLANRARGGRKRRQSFASTSAAASSNVRPSAMDAVREAYGDTTVMPIGDDWHTQSIGNQNSGDMKSRHDGEHIDEDWNADPNPNPSFRKRNCGLCNATGRRFHGRRYLPCAYVNEQGEFQNEVIADYLRIVLPEKPSLGSTSFLSPGSGIPASGVATGELGPSETVELIYGLLVMCCIRIPTARQHTPFVLHDKSPRPNFPSTWVHACEDALALAQQPDISRLFAAPDVYAGGGSNQSSGAALDADASGTALNGAAVNPIKKSRRTQSSAQANMTRLSAAVRQRFQGLALSRPLTVAEVDDIGRDSEFKRFYRPNRDDPSLLDIHLRQIEAVQRFLREHTIAEYRRIIVSDLEFSMDTGTGWVRVAGEGIHHCRIRTVKRKSLRILRHDSNQIYFVIRRMRSGNIVLYQYCHDEDCKTPEKIAYVYGITAEKDLNMITLFNPREGQSTFGNLLNAEQTAQAKLLMTKRVPVSLPIKKTGKLAPRKHEYIKPEDERKIASAALVQDDEATLNDDVRLDETLVDEGSDDAQISDDVSDFRPPVAYRHTFYRADPKIHRCPDHDNHRLRARWIQVELLDS